MPRDGSGNYSLPHDFVADAAASPPVPPTASRVMEQLADIAAQLNDTETTETLTTQLAAKANTSDVTAALAAKANTSDVTTALSAKADTSAMTTALAAKADAAATATAYLITTSATTDTGYIDGNTDFCLANTTYLSSLMVTASSGLRFGRNYHARTADKSPGVVLPVADT